MVMRMHSHASKLFRAFTFKDKCVVANTLDSGEYDVFILSRIINKIF